MSRTSRPITVTLGDLQERVDARIRSGGYASASEVLRADSAIATRGGLVPKPDETVQRHLSPLRANLLAGGSVDQLHRQSSCFDKLSMKIEPSRHLPARSTSSRACRGTKDEAASAVLAIPHKIR